MKKAWLFIALSAMILLGGYNLLLNRELWFDEAYSWAQSVLPLSWWFAAHPVWFFISIWLFVLAGYALSRNFKKWAFASAILVAGGVKLLVESGISPRDVHPPVFYLLLKGWMGLFGQSTFAMRGMALVFGLLAMWQVWIYCERKHGSRVAAVAVVLMALGTTYIHYFTENRMYSIVVFLSVLAFNLLDSVVEGDRGWRYWAYVAVLILLPMTHYFVGFIIVLHALIFWREKGFKEAFKAFLSVGFGLIPIGYFFLLQSARIVNMWLLRPTVMSWLSSISFGLNAVGDEGFNNLMGMIFVILILGLIGVYVLKKKEKWTTTEFALIIFPQFFGIVLGILFMTYHHRYFLMTLWLLPVLMAEAFIWLYDARRWIGLAAMLVVLLFQVWAIGYYYSAEHFELRKAADFVIQDEERTGVKMVLHDSPWSAVPTKYYMRGAGIENGVFTDLEDLRHLNSAGGDVISSADVFLSSNYTLPVRFYYYEADRLIPGARNATVLYDLDGLRIRLVQDSTTLVK